MSDIRIRVGVALDANAAAVLAPIEAAVKRVQKTTEQAMQAAGQAVAKETEKGATAAERSWKKLERELERDANAILRAEERAAKAATRAVDKEAKDQARARERAARADVREAERSANERVAIEKRAAREIAAARRIEERNRGTEWWRQDLLTGKRVQNFGGGGAIGVGRRAGIRVSRGTALAYGLVGRALSTATDVGLDIAQGVGYDTDLGSHVQKAREQRTLATDISNSGNLPGTRLVAPDEILSKAREAGNAARTDVGEALQALQAFVGKTGDLQTGLDSLERMAVLSKATGTHLHDMASASADVSNAVGDIPDKANVVYSIMTAIAGQGKLGAVEIRDLASQMAKLAAPSQKFVGGAAKNIVTLGIIAQEARAVGGAASAAQATQSVMSLASTLQVGTTLKHWAGTLVPKPGGKPGEMEGLNPYTDSSYRQLADPMDIIRTALEATRGNQKKLYNLFPNRLALRAVAGFQDKYNEAYTATKGTDVEKNAAGIAAVNREFEHLKQAQLDSVEVQRAFAATLHNSESSSVVFNNKMTELADKLTAAVLPNLDMFGSMLVKGATEVTSWIAALNPGAKHDIVSDTATTLVGKEEPLERAFRDSVKFNKKTGKTEASGVAYEAIKGMAFNRIRNKAELGTEIDTEKDKLASEEKLAANPVNRLIGDKVRHALGLSTAEERAGALRTQITADQAKFDALAADQKSAVGTLSRIENLISKGVIELTKPDTPPAAQADQSGRAPPNADFQP